MDYMQRVKDSLDQLNAQECSSENIKKMATMMGEFKIATGRDYQPAGETWALAMKMYSNSERRTNARLRVNELKDCLVMRAAVLEETRKQVDALKTKLAAAEAELKQCNDELTELDDDASEIRALKAEFEAAGGNPKLEAFLKKLIPGEDDYAESIDALIGDLKELFSDRGEMRKCRELKNAYKDARKLAYLRRHKGKRIDAKVLNNSADQAWSRLLHKCFSGGPGDACT